MSTTISIIVYERMLARSLDSGAVALQLGRGLSNRFGISTCCHASLYQSGYRVRNTWLTTSLTKVMHGTKTQTPDFTSALWNSTLYGFNRYEMLQAFLPHPRRFAAYRARWTRKGIPFSIMATAYIFAVGMVTATLYSTESERLSIVLSAQGQSKDSLQTTGMRTPQVCEACLFSMISA